MTITDIHVVSEFISSVLKILGENGIIIRTGSDFHEFEERLKRQPLRHSIGPKFTPQNNELCEKSGFWIIGEDRRGEIVHTQAVRTLDLEGHSLAYYMKKQYQEFIPYPIDEQKSGYCSAPGSTGISGLVCFHGELWLKGGPNGYRGTSITALLARLAMAMSLARWSPDHIFGFMYPDAAYKGLAAREGYQHMEPRSMFFSLPGREKVHNLWIVWMNREDIRYITSICPYEIYEEFEAIAKGKLQPKAA